MAESSFSLSSVQGTVYTYANAYVSANNDGTATITIVAGARMNPGAYVWSTGVHGDLYINNVLVGSLRIFGDEQDYYGSNDYSLVSATYTLGKTHSAQSIACSVGFFEYIDGTNLGWRQTLAPTNVSVSAKTSYTVSFNANGGSNAPSAQTKWYAEDLTLTTSQPTRSGYTFKGWSSSANGSVEYSSGGTYSQDSAITLYAVWQVNAPTVAPTIGTNTRNSDTSNTVSWTYSVTVPPVTAFYIERSTNGGAFAQVAQVSGSGSGSYVDTTTQPNNYYKYRVRCGNATGKSPYSGETGTTYNTPSAPTNLSAVFNSSQHVILSWAQTGNTENQVKIETSVNSGSTWSTVETVSGTNLNTYTDTNPPGGTVLYRVTNIANYTPVLSSQPSNSAEVLTLAPPNAPTLRNPVSGQVLDMPSSVVLSWTHNPTDGTSQTAATVQVSTNGGSSWTSYNVTTAQQYTLDTSSYAANTTVTWRVRTKGTYEEYGAYSANRSFYVRQSPSVTITNPASTDGGTITDVPVQIGFTYSDNSGTFSSASLSIRDANDAVIYSNTPEWVVSGSSYSFSIPVTDLLPVNDSTYTLIVTANSSSGLSVTAQRIFATDYTEPNPPSLDYEIDSDNCSVTLTVSEGTGSSSIQTVAVGVFRVDSDGEKAIQATMNSGDSVTDYLPPLDQEFTYRAVAYTVNGLTAQTLVNVTVDSQGACFFNWGDGFSKSASFAMDLSWKTSIDHDRALYKVVGLTDPVVRTTKRRTKTLSASGVVWWQDDSQLEQLQNIPGAVYFREPKGHVIPVVVKVDLTYPKGQPTTSASVSMTQITEVSNG